MPSRPGRAGNKDSEDKEKIGDPWTGIIICWSEMLSEFFSNLSSTINIFSYNNSRIYRIARVVTLNYHE
jgi:hypothetical protein